jgi:hypothetical protein
MSNYRESAIEQYLTARALAMGGECRKVKWIGRSGAPDRLVMLPGKTIWVELKRPGEKAKPHQRREHLRMARMGQRVEVVDSFARADEVLA